VELGDLFDVKKVRKTLQSIVKYNWKSMKDFVNFMRVYAVNEEKGLLLCTWPKSGRPAIPMPYCDEVWGGGIEYQVGSHLIYEGFVKEGLAIIKALRDRYDGEKRNPWNEVECGNHYARSMASWAVLLALSGFHYSAPEKTMSWSPRISQSNFRCFFSVDSGWGIYSQKVGAGKSVGASLLAQIDVVYGKLVLQELRLNVGPRCNIGAVGQGFSPAKVKLGGKSIPASITRNGKSISIRFPKPLILEKESFRIILS
jgi:hypothetical protein